MIIPSIETDQFAYLFLNILLKIIQIVFEFFVPLYIFDQLQERIADHVCFIFVNDAFVYDSESYVCLFLLVLQLIELEGDAHVDIVIEVGCAVGGKEGVEGHVVVGGDADREVGGTFNRSFQLFYEQHLLDVGEVLFNFAIF